MGDKSVVDVLGRDSIIHGLKDVIFMLSENREGKVFALDGKWGYGKSYILDILEKDLLVEQSEQTGSSGIMFLIIIVGSTIITMNQL